MHSTEKNISALLLTPSHIETDPERYIVLKIIYE
jgi:hypothetical protein